MRGQVIGGMEFLAHNMKTASKLEISTPINLKVLVEAFLRITYVECVQAKNDGISLSKRPSLAEPRSLLDLLHTSSFLSSAPSALVTLVVIFLGGT